MLLAALFFFFPVQLIFFFQKSHHHRRSESSRGTSSLMVPFLFVVVCVRLGEDRCWFIYRLACYVGLFLERAWCECLLCCCMCLIFFFTFLQVPVATRPKHVLILFCVLD